MQVDKKKGDVLKLMYRNSSSTHPHSYVHVYCIEPVVPVYSESFRNRYIPSGMPAFCFPRPPRWHFCR